MRLLSVLIQFFSVTQYTTLALTTYQSTYDNSLKGPTQLIRDELNFFLFLIPQKT